jgi:pSer/pThr/pTyr-binding forkhead associated (FHA) protein
MSANLDRLIVRLNDMVIQTVVLDIPALTIGRSPDAALMLPHPRISRRHAEIRREAGATVIIDLGSANGIFVNGERLQAHEVRPLMYGAVVQIGPYTLTCHTANDTALPAADAADGETVEDFRTDMQIHIDSRHQQEQVEEIVESEFFHHLRDEKQRLRPHSLKPPEKNGK